MKKTISILLAMLLLFSVSTFAEEADLNFDLSVDGENAVTVPSGSTVTVTFKVTASADAKEYHLNSIQNEIKFDESFFSFVKNSLTFTKTDTQGDLNEKFAGKRVYMNGMNTTYKKEQTVGSFKLRVIATSGSGKVETTLPLAYTDKGEALTISCTDLTVTIGESGGEGGGNGSGGNDGGGNGSSGNSGSTGFGGGGGVSSLANRKYTKDIFGNEHSTHIGYINGYPDGSVKPEGDITREEIAAVLYRITNHDYEAPFVATGDAFPDVASVRWSAHNIEYMADKAIILGYPDGEFKPTRNLTRAEFAALIGRFAKIVATGYENPFPDVSQAHWAYNEILSLAHSGLMTGYEDGTFRPENNISRAEVMTVINKILGRKPLESYVKSLNFNPYSDLYPDTWYYITVLEATITHNYWLNTDGYEYMWENWK